MERVDEMKTEPVVGRFYLVPCVRKTVNGKVRFMPVTGPKHEDDEHIGFPHQHWHYDYRFLSIAFMNGVRVPYGSVLIKALQYGPKTAPVDCEEVGSRVEYRHLRCQRRPPQYPLDVVERAWLPKLRIAYTDKRVTCGKCPHRGLPLESLPREPGTDIVTCPGHGLRWDLKTGALIKQEPARQEGA